MDGMREEVKWKWQADFLWKANAPLIQNSTRRGREQIGNTREKLHAWCVRGAEMKIGSWISVESNTWHGSCLVPPHFALKNGIVPSNARSRSLFWKCTMEKKRSGNIDRHDAAWRTMSKACSMRKLVIWKHAFDLVLCVKRDDKVESK
jgi:hypothetical protein